MSLDLLVRIFSMIPWLRASSVPTPKVRKIITAGRSHIGDRRPLRPWPRLLRLFCGMSKCQVRLSTRAGWPFFLSQSPLNQKMGFAEFSQQAGWSHHRSYLSSTISWWKHCLIVWKMLETHSLMMSQCKCNLSASNELRSSFHFLSNN